MSAKNYNFSINGLRGLCILLILIYHVALSNIVPETAFLKDAQPAIRYFFSTFCFGVEIFFMISGYVIIGSLRRHETVRAFLVDRVFRIYSGWLPIHLFIFIVGPFAAIPFMQNLDAAHWVFYFFTNLFLLHPIYSLPMSHPASWSLSYEWIFYLLAGSAAFLLRKHYPRWSVVFLVGGAALALLNLFPRALFFLPGVILALNEDKIRKHADLFKFPLVALITFLLAWNIPGAIPAEISVLMIDWFTDYRILLAILALGAGFYAFTGVVFGKGLLSRLLSTKLFQFYGKISYSFYLWSSLVLSVSKKFVVAYIMPGVTPWVGVAAFAVLSLVFSTIVSWISWRYAEVYLSNTVKRKLGIHKKAPTPQFATST